MFLIENGMLISKMLNCISEQQFPKLVSKENKKHFKKLKVHFCFYIS
jgi:hypothetical protein